MPNFSNRVFSFGMMTLIALLIVFLGAMNAHANEHGFAITDGLSSSFQLPGANDVARNAIHIETTLQADSSAVDNLDSVAAGYQSQGFKIGRISASWNTRAKNRTVSSQIKWLSANGFSISLEDAPKTLSYSTDGTTSNNNENTAPSLILSWQGGPRGASGDYRVTTAGQKFDTSNLTGWGLNVEGGWQIDDLFATLSVTYGKGIDSYILQRYGNDLVVTPNYSNGTTGELGAALSIRPSLYYSLNNNSNFHVSLGHYRAKNSVNNSGIDTLDTINMGYSWSPWPSTKLGIELIGQNVGGRNGVDKESDQVQINAQQRF